MTNADFWKRIDAIINGDFATEGLQMLDYYAELFINGRVVYKRFSPFEQHGCSAGGATHVIASILAAAKARSDSGVAPYGDNFKREIECGAQQAECIEQWARCIGCWTDCVDKTLSSSLGEQIAEGGEAKVYDHGATLVKTIGLDYFIQPILALDRISLHNAYFPETRLTVLGFGRTENGEFKIVVEQPFVEGIHVNDSQIEEYMHNMGFELRNPRNWTYATPDIYLSDMHDENILQTADGTIVVVDCDIRINTPELKQGGTRTLSTDVEVL
ncbi:MAG: hypothetical protein J6X62_06365 [Bacteroidales bacterium]|nr:hypothetical protein [Bacteroidales bacterium]